MLDGAGEGGGDICGVGQWLFFIYIASSPILLAMSFLRFLIDIKFNDSVF
jgi:hypothetical protein